MICTATSGTLFTSSLTGPGLGGGGPQLQAEGSIGRTGQNSYSVTNDTLSGYSNGDIYTCTAINDVPSPDSSTVLTGMILNCLSFIMCVFSGRSSYTNVTTTDAGTALVVLWSPPSGGATVTGYIVQYRIGSIVGNTGYLPLVHLCH